MSKPRKRPLASSSPVDDDTVTRIYREVRGRIDQAASDTAEERAWRLAAVEERRRFDDSYAYKRIHEIIFKWITESPADSRYERLYDREVAQQVAEIRASGGWPDPLLDD